MTQTILRNTTLPVLTRQADQQGLTPIHLAASFNSRRTIIPLLMADRHVAYMKDTEGRTALHIAAYSGHKTIMKKILSSCPDCYELVDDKRGWNALHFAVNSFYPRGAVRLSYKTRLSKAFGMRRMPMETQFSITILIILGSYCNSEMNRDLIRWPSTNKTWTLLTWL